MGLLALWYISSFGVGKGVAVRRRAFLARWLEGAVLYFLARNPSVCCCFSCLPGADGAGHSAKLEALQTVACAQVIAGFLTG